MSDNDLHGWPLSYPRPKPESSSSRGGQAPTRTTETATGTLSTDIVAALRFHASRTVGGEGELRSDLLQAADEIEAMQREANQPHERDCGPWVSVLDRLPAIPQGRNFVDVIACHASPCAPERVSAAQYQAVVGWYIEGVAPWSIVTYWMPLPEPPKSEGHNRNCSVQDCKKPVHREGHCFFHFNAGEPFECAAPKDCDHQWVSADNPVVTGAVVCLKCKTIAAAESPGSNVPRGKCGSAEQYEEFFERVYLLVKQVRA